jgi:hypothetical protein
VMTLATVGSIAYWLGVGVLAMFGINSFDSILNVFSPQQAVEAKSIWMLMVIAVLLIIATTLQKTLIAPLEQTGVESLTGMEYQLDDSRFLATPNAILDAINVAAQRGYETIDLLSFSLGAVLATDAIFPRRARQQLGAPPLVIENWITLGYPYDLIRWYSPGYFTERQPARVDFHRWVNVVVQDDFLGTKFSEGDGRGIHLNGRSGVRAPDLNHTFPAEQRVGVGWQDWFRPGHRLVNHRIYWDDEDARAPTCFAGIVDVEATGWARGLLAILSEKVDAKRLDAS